MERQINVGIIGYGGMAGWHREQLATIEGICVKGVYDIDKERVDLAISQGLIGYSSSEELLQDESIELILIATPNDLHKPYAIEAMRAGKNVISEKPVTLCSEDLQEMMDVSKETNRFLTVHQNRRWDEDFLTIRNVMEQDLVGEIYRLESRVHGSRGIPGDWRGEKEKGGGMILDWGVHLLDQILLLYPGVMLNRIYAQVTNVTNQLVDDGFTVTLEFENGVSALVEVGTSNFISLPRWYVLGENGTAIIRDWSLDGEVVVATGINEEDVVPVKTAAGFTKTMAPRRDDTIKTMELPIAKSDVRDFYRNVIGVISEKETSRIQLEEVARVMRVMEAIFESARTKQVIEFER